MWFEKWSTPDLVPETYIKTVRRELDFLIAKNGWDALDMQAKLEALDTWAKLNASDVPAEWDTLDVPAKLDVLGTQDE